MLDLYPIYLIMLLVHAVDLWIYSSWGPGRLQWTISSPGNHPKSPVQGAPQWPACRRVGSAVPNWHPLVDTREAGCLGASTHGLIQCQSLSGADDV